MEINVNKFMDEFRKQLEEDHWGDIDPDWFSPQDNCLEHDSLKEAMERTFQKLNLKTC